MSDVAETAQRSERSSPESHEPERVIRDVPEHPIERQAQADALRTRERAREKITITLALILFGTIGLAFLKVGTPHWDQAKDWLSVVLPVEAGALGSAIAWYFATRGRHDA